MENINITPVTPEMVWAALKETDRLLKETIATSDKRSAEADERMKKMHDDIDKHYKSLLEQNKTIGSHSNNLGSFAEDYFFNSFENGRQNFFGEKFDRIEKNVKPLDAKIEDEYDILLINGKTVGIVETKFKAHENDLPKIVRKAETFRVNFPQYRHHRIYLGVASFVFYPELEKACTEQGLVVIKQVCDTVVIYDKHLKVF